MFFITRPTGGLLVGKALLKAPFVDAQVLGAPARIVFVCDIHLRRSGAEHAQTIVSLIKRLSPELLLLGGDIAEYDEGAIAFIKLLGGVDARYGKFAVSGNNDDTRFSRDTETLRRLYSESGVMLLSNETATVSIGGRNVEIAGVYDSYEHTPCASGLFSSDECAYRILLSHAPHSFLLEQACPAPHLMLSGHTHGGQVNILGLTCYELMRYEHWYSFTHIAGVKRINDTICLVSRGIGVSKYSIRAFSRPEIHLIT